MLWLVSLLLASWPVSLDAQVTAPRALGLWDAVRESLSGSPEVEAALKESALASLEEPLLLSNLDPKFESSYSVADDRSPRAAPAFQGAYSESERWEAGFAQSTLLGTEARLRWAGERLKNPAAFRVLDPSVDSRLNLELRQPLLRYFWGRPDVARRKRARAGAAGAQARLRLARERAAMESARAYLELHFSSRQAIIQEEGVRDAGMLLAKYEEKKRYGLAEESDLLQARSSLEAQETALLMARSQAEKARNALWAVLCREGSPVPLETALPGNLPRLPEPEADEARALFRRPDVAAAGLGRESLEWGLRVEILDTLPDLALSLSYGLGGLHGGYGGSWRDLSSLDHSVKTAGLGVNVPLGFWKERVTRKQAALVLEVARAREREARTRAVREIRDARENLELSRRRVEAGTRLVELERRKFRAEEESFRRGRSSTDLLLRFQQDIRRARIELLRAETDDILSRLDLARSLGLLSDWLSP